MLRNISNKLEVEERLEEAAAMNTQLVGKYVNVIRGQTAVEFTLISLDIQYNVPLSAIHATISH